jgi:hydroxypyruvate reductase
MISNSNEFLLGLFNTAVAASQAEQCLAGNWPDLPAGNLRVIACGKAAIAMAKAARAHYGDNASGLIIAPQTHRDNAYDVAGFQLLFASHPVPDQSSVDAAHEALECAGSLTEDDLLLVLMSGGSSALLCMPVAEISLEEKREVTRHLLGSGATIQEINCVRKHLSRIKGGGLAAACPAPLVTLAISDVPGDDVALIGSGPTMRHTSSRADARAILKRYRINASPAVAKALEGEHHKEHGVHAQAHRSSSRVVASGMTALKAAEAACRQQKVDVMMLGDTVQGDAVTLAEEHTRLARKLYRKGKPVCILSGGETSLSLGPSPGTGGRNSCYALALAIELDGHPGIWALAADTDGFDGVGGHAGAQFGPHIGEAANAVRLHAEEFLDQDNSAAFFAIVGGLLVTGATHTNVNDFRAILILPEH